MFSFFKKTKHRQTQLDIKFEISKKLHEENSSKISNDLKLMSEEQKKKRDRFNHLHDQYFPTQNK